MTEPRTRILLQLIRVLLRPAVKLALKSGVLLQETIQLLKEVYVEVAEEELGVSTKKINVSRLSVMTGVHRADVTEIFKNRTTVFRDEPITLVSKVINRWTSTRPYCTSSGTPRTLSYDGAKSQFNKLVSSISTTVNPGTVLFELLRNGAAETTPRGLKLVRATRALGKFPEKSYQLLSKDIESLVAAVDENIALQQSPSEQQPGNAHYRTEYDNIQLRHLPKLRPWIVARARKFHQEMRQHLAKLDGDSSPKTKQDSAPGARVSVSVFSFIEEPLANRRDDEA